MKFLRLMIGATLLCAAALPTISHAQIVQTNACFSDIFAQMAQEQRMYRSVVFGLKPAEDAAIGSVRYDTNGHSWQKTSNNSWQSLNPEEEGRTKGNQGMDDSSDTAPRRGIFEIKRSSSSDLLPSLLQSLRALQCNLYTICELANASGQEDAGDTLTVQVEGCLEQELPTVVSCKEGNILESSVTQCDRAAASIVERESQLLHLVVTYDAAYRTLLQFAGNFEGFLKDFRTPLLEPLWQTVRALGAIDSIPCFNAQCDR